MRRSWLGFLVLATASACSDGGGGADDGGTDLADGVGDVGDDDGGAEALDEASDVPDVPVDPWAGVTILSARAPDRTSVTVTFSRDPGRAAAEVLGLYTIEGTGGELVVEAVTYDPATATATLQTAKQKLGVEHTVFVTDAAIPAGPLRADFFSADTALLWTTDLMTYEERQVTAVRVAIGERCVVYIEESRVAPIPASWLAYFDSDVYPLETTMFREAPDQDLNGKVVFLVVTGDGFGGYFNPIDRMSDASAMRMWGMHSNELEVIYINADIIDYGFDYWTQVVPHEFQHLLYAEEHPDIYEDWSYHNEGLAECAARAVNGGNDYAVGTYFGDPSGLVVDGLSLVDWTYAQYENYAVAYLFWSYVAGQLAGVPSYADIFHLPSGDPADVDAFLRTELGLGFNEVQRNGLIALWAQQASGTYSFGDVVDLGGAGLPPRLATPGAARLSLKPFAGTFVTAGVAELDYTGTQGPDIVYVGLNGTGGIDLEAPFDITGGGLLVYNAEFEYDVFAAQSAGLPFPAPSPSPSAFARPVSPRWFSAAWADPPPLPPVRSGPFEAWRSMMVRVGLVRPVAPPAP
jgi:hypothetical protein